VGVPIVLVRGLSGATTWWAKNVAVFGQRAQIYALVAGLVLVAPTIFPPAAAWRRAV
jgi:hypothetical protein